MQQISDLNLKILLSQRLMGLVRKKHLVGIAPNQTSPPFAEREGFFCSQTAKATLSITNPWGFSSSRLFVKKNTPRGCVLLFCGKRGIRTPGASRHAGFQDRCNRPLYHLSVELRCKITTFF